MASLPIRWIEARTYCHATEDEARVETALAFACPEGQTVREPLEGHFGNPLVRLSRRLQDKESVRRVWDRWAAAGLPKGIQEDVDARVDDDGILHLRIDKQAAFEGRLDLAKDADAIDVRIKIIAYPAKPEQARKAARALLPEAM
ncbi:MAG TPA: RNA-binding domain-containing protein [Thermoplasmata archaeon]|jgi:RNA binding exosome subunit|nr:RNA-binding domain-containing protein [Thermoplasmata archaeon]